MLKGVEMKEFVGVKSWFDLESQGQNAGQEMKQLALMFDHLAITAEDYAHLSFFSITGLSGELDWLVEQGILRCYELSWPETLLQDPHYASLLSRTQHTPTLEQALSNWDGQTNYMFDVAQILVRAELDARLTAIELSKTKNVDAYPMIDFCAPQTTIPHASMTDVIEIVLEQLPVPDEQTSWENIIEFRSDPEARKSFTSLRDLMGILVRMELEPGEVQLRLQTLIDSYEHYMRVHRIKTRQETLKTTLIAEAGFITSGWLAGLGALPGIAGMIITPIYSLRQRSIALLAEELKAPGREVAYIPKAKRTFG